MAKLLPVAAGVPVPETMKFLVGAANPDPVAAAPLDNGKRLPLLHLLVC